MKMFRKLRSDSYEANLSPEEREQLYSWLLQPGLSLEQTCQRARPWKGGKRDGQKPGPEAVAKIGRRLRISSALDQVSTAAKVEAAAMTRLLEHVLPGSIHEEMVDLAMKHIAQDVISKTLQQLDPDSRTAAAKLMLTRSDQHLDREKFMLEVRKYEDAIQAAKARAKQDGIGARRHGGIPAEVLDQIEKELKLL
jgi:hypothetical protein